MELLNHLRNGHQDVFIPRGVCGCVHIHIVVITTDVHASL